MTESKTHDPKQKNHVMFGYREVDEDEKTRNVKHVFDVVAPRYDLMNDLLSFGLHRWWKHITIGAMGLKEGSCVLDIASGTCDLAMAFAKRVGKTGTVWASDINYEMLSRGAKRCENAKLPVRISQCDAEALPFSDGMFDAVSVSFGLRNMTHKDKALREMLRVLKPGGLLAVLEFSHCARWARPFYDFYSFHVMPRLGALVAGDAPSYRYLAESIRVHPNQEHLAAMMKEAGFAEVTWKNLCFGVCALHCARKA